MKKIHWIGLTLIAGAIALLILLPNTESQEKLPQLNEFGENYEIDIIQACVMAQFFVEDRLKSPSTADFPPCRDWVIAYVGNQTYVGSGYVDSQNSFGATVRAPFTFELQDKQDETWILKDITFYE